MTRPPLLIPRADVLPPPPSLGARLQEAFAGLGDLCRGLGSLALAAALLWLAWALLAHVSFLLPWFHAGAALIHHLTD